MRVKLYFNIKEIRKFLWIYWALIWMLSITLITVICTLFCLMFGINKISIQRTIHKTWGHLLIAGIGCKVKTSGLNKLDNKERYVFVSNHTSILDIPILMSVLNTSFSWTIKKELFNIPLFGAAIKYCGYIQIDRKSPKQSMIDILNKMDTKISIIFFPEGTRSKDGTLLPFKIGAFSTAINTGYSIVPIVIINAIDVMPKKSIIVNSVKIKVLICDPIPTLKLKQYDCNNLLQLVHKKMNNNLKTI